MDASLVLTVDATYCSALAGIKLGTWARFLDELARLHAHNAAHYEHSLRVGIYAFALARSEGKRDLHFPLMGGCGHDIGKCGISNDILDAPAFGEEEMEAVKAHAYLGYEYWKDTFLFTGLVAGMHHKFQETPYGIDWEDVTGWPLNETTRAKVEQMARFVSLCDFFDAMITRGTKFEGDVKEVMMRHFNASPHGIIESRIDFLLAHQISWEFDEVTEGGR